MLRLRLVQVLAILLMLLMAIVLGTYRTDREFINLAPSEGPAYQIVLESNTTYEQSFIAQRSSITRLGVFLKPIHQLDAAQPITISVLRARQKVATATINSAFIDASGFTQVRFQPAIHSVPGETLMFTLAVPPGLSGKFAAVARARDGTFSGDDIPLVISGELQRLPLAHQMYHAYQPAFAMQLAGLCVYAVLLIFFPRLLPTAAGATVHAAVISTIAVVPALSLHHWPALLHSALFLSLLGSYHLYRASGISLPAAWLGAHVLSLTTWWALQASGSREKLLCLATVPLLIFVIIFYSRLQKRTVALTLGLLVVTGTLFLTGTFTASPMLPISASIKDIWLDPYQVAAANKIISNPITWDHFGSYVGISAMLFAGIGVVWRASRYKFIACGALAVLLIIHYLPPAVPSLFFLNYAIILPTAGISFFASVGLDGIRRYLQPGKVTTVVTSALVILVLLDLLFVLGSTLEARYLL